MNTWVNSEYIKYFKFKEKMIRREKMINITSVNI